MTPREIALSICEPWFNGDPCEGCECHKVCKKLVERIETAIQAERVPEIDFGNMAQTVDSKESDHVADTGKTSDQSEDARGMVATSRESRQVEPVAWRFHDGRMWCYVNHISDLSASPKFEPLYTAPPKREPLTDAEIKRLYDSLPSKYTLAMFARAVERAHGIGGEE